MPTLTQLPKGEDNEHKNNIIDKEEVRRFVGDFNKLFKDLEEWKSNAVQIESWKEHFLKEYRKIFNVSRENEVEMETRMETESRPIVDREKKLQKVEEKLLSYKTNERFTNYDGVMSDPNLTLAEKINHIQKQLKMQREEKSTTLRYRENYLKNAVFDPRKAIKKFWRKRSFQDSGCYF